MLTILNPMLSSAI